MKSSSSIADFFTNPPSLATNGDQKTISAFNSFFRERLKTAQTRAVYGNSIIRFFDWHLNNSEHWSIKHVDHAKVTCYGAWLDTQFSPNHVNVQLSSLNTFFAWLMKEGCIPANPAHSVRSNGIAKETKQSLSIEEGFILLEGINVETVGGLRNRAMLAVMMYAFAKTDDVVYLNRESYLHRDERWWLNLGRKKHFRQIPVNATLQQYMTEYLERIKLPNPDSPLFPVLKSNTSNRVGGRLSKRTVQKIVKLCTKDADTKIIATPHSLRAAGLRAFLETGGGLEDAQKLAGHSSPMTTASYQDQSTAQPVYEGDLDGLVALLTEATSNPFRNFVERSGIFRLSVSSTEKS